MAIQKTDSTGNTWTIDNTGRLNGLSRPPTGNQFGTPILDFTAYGIALQGNSFDSFISFASPTVNATGDDQTVQGTISGTSVVVTKRSTIGNGYARFVDSFVNNGTTSVTFTLKLADNIYFDGSTGIAATSSGNTSVESTDDWVLARNVSAQGFPVFGRVMSGGDGSPDSFILRGNDSIEATFTITLAPGERKTFLNFALAASDVAAATTLATQLSNLASAVYLEGLTTTELDTLQNFTQDVTSSTSVSLLGYQRNVTLTGTDNVNATGNARNNNLMGNTGNNSLSGGAGNDTLSGGGGQDTLAGGIGDDTYIINNATTTLVENGNEGVDTVQTDLTSLNLSAAQYVHIENVTLTGTTAASVTGNANNNVIDARRNALADTLGGGLGNDTYLITELDTVSEAANQGTDEIVVNVNYSLASIANVENLSLQSGAGDISATGNALANLLRGNEGNNRIVANDGNDTLDGGSGIDTMTGGTGNDVYIIDNLADVIRELSNQGNDTIVTPFSFALTDANIENVTLTGQAYRAVGSSVRNILTGNSEANLLDGLGGADTMRGGDGSDVYVVDSVGDVVQEAFNEGIDTVRTSVDLTLTDHVENASLLDNARNLTGNALANTLKGNIENNQITGLDGNDSLSGAGGNDTLTGGNGNDILVGDEGPDASIVANATTINGEELVLNLSAPNAATGTITVKGAIGAFDLSASALNIVYILDKSGSTTDAFLGQINVGDVNNDGTANTVLDAAIASLNNLNGSLAKSGLTQSIDVTLVEFSSSSSVLYKGGLNTDRNGNQTSDISEVLRSIRSDGGTEYAMALNTALRELNSGGNTRNLVFFLSDGAPNDIESGYLAASRAIRETGIGGTFIQAIGLGNGAIEQPLDLVDDGVDNNSALIVRNPETLNAALLDASGYQTDAAALNSAWIEIYRNDELVDVIDSSRFTLTPVGYNFESESFSLNAAGTDLITAKLVSSTSNEFLASVSAPVRLSSFISNDSLDGGDGNDILLGGTGSDTLVGGTGNDTLDGQSGSDNMDGGSGDDTYYVDQATDVITELPNNGNDTVITTLSAFTLGNDFENLILSGSALTGTGNSLANTISGNALDNALSGDSGNDTLTGDAGNDLLDGGTGADSMTGGTGSDTYIVENAGDIVVEFFSATDTNDKVVSSFNLRLDGFGSFFSSFGNVYSVSSQIEHGTLASGSAATSILGNTSRNILIGNENANQLTARDGDDTLDGGSGADTMDGGIGNDYYFQDNASDAIIDSAGIDTLETLVDGVVLSADLENMILGEGAATTATGNDLNNEIRGNDNNNTLSGGAGTDSLFGGSGNDRLSGDAGADYLDGGAGNDTYIVTDQTDRIFEAVNQGADTVLASVSFALGTNLENLTLTGTSSIAGAGNSLANRISGNNGSNRLVGHSGNDTMTGGSGADTLFGGAGADSLDGGSGADVYQTLSARESTITNLNASNIRSAGIDAVISTVGDIFDFGSRKVTSVSNATATISDVVGQQARASALLDAIAASITEKSGGAFLVQVTDNDVEKGTDGSFAGNYLVYTNDSTLGNDDVIIELIGAKSTAGITADGDLVIRS